MLRVARPSRPRRTGCAPRCRKWCSRCATTTRPRSSRRPA
jgi:hypothetical protein